MSSRVLLSVLAGCSIFHYFYRFWTGLRNGRGRGEEEEEEGRSRAEISSTMFVESLALLVPPGGVGPVDLVVEGYVGGAGLLVFIGGVVREFSPRELHACMRFSVYGRGMYMVRAVVETGAYQGQKDVVLKTKGRRSGVRLERDGRRGAPPHKL